MRPLLRLVAYFALATSAHAAIPEPAMLVLGLEEAIDDAAEDATANPWTGNVGLAMNGSRTTSNSLSFRFSAGAERKTDEDQFTMSLLYLTQYADGDLSENNGLFDIEQLWNCSPDAPWNGWVQGSTQFNANEGYRTRITTYGGVGYKVLNNEKLTINLKGGLGVKWDYRGNTSVVAQSICEAAAHWTLDEGLVLTSASSIANDLDSVSSFLLRIRVQLEAALKAIDGLSLTIGIRDEYDSTPSAGSSYNQLWYWAGLQYNF